MMTATSATRSAPLLEVDFWHPVQERILYKDVYEGGALKETVYYFNGFYQVENSSGIFNFTQVKQDGVLVAENTPSGKRFYSADPLGSSSLVTDGSGTPLENTTYGPYGEILSGGSSRFDYEDKEYSSATQSYDFNFRKQCTDLHIFCQPDTLLFNVYDPQMLNRYAFERNNPYRYNDPDGHFLIETILLVETVLLTGVIYGTVYTEFAVMKQQTYGTYELYKEARAQGITTKEMFTNRDISRALQKEANKRLLTAATSAFASGTISGELDAIGDFFNVPGFGEAVSTYFGLSPKETRSQADLSKIEIKGTSGVTMSVGERAKNTETINNDKGFVKIREGVYSKTTTEKTADGKTKTTTRVVYK